QERKRNRAVQLFEQQDARATQIEAHRKGLALLDALSLTGRQELLDMGQSEPQPRMRFDLFDSSFTSQFHFDPSHSAVSVNSEEPEPEPVKDDREQGEDRRYQPGDHPKTVGAAAERDAPDIHAPNARDQR